MVGQNLVLLMPPIDAPYIQKRSVQRGRLAGATIFDSELAQAFGVGWARYALGAAARRSHW